MAPDKAGVTMPTAAMVPPDLEANSRKTELHLQPTEHHLQSTELHLQSTELHLQPTAPQSLQDLSLATQQPSQLEITHPSDPLAATTTNNDEFHRFPNFAPEIQLLIWKFAFLPRVVQIASNKRSSGTYKDLHEYCDGQNSTITLLRTCKDARKVVQSSYKKLYLNMNPDRLNPRDYDAFVYVDYDMDTIYVDVLCGKATEFFDAMAEVKHLAMKKHHLFIDTRWLLFKKNCFWTELRKTCPDLQRLSFVLAPFERFRVSGEEMRLIKIPGEAEFKDVDRYLNFGLEPDLVDLGIFPYWASKTYDFQDEFYDEVKEYHPHLKPIEVDFAFQAKTSAKHHGWHLSYFTGDDSGGTQYGPECDCDEDCSCGPKYAVDTAHWHTEYIEPPEDGKFFSCRKAFPADRDDPVFCAECCDSRWLPEKNDAIWLKKKELYDPN